MGSIYKLTDGDKCYYGSTTRDIKERLMAHKCINNRCSSKQLNRDNLTIELVEELEDVAQLKCREAWFIENNECVNMYIPYRTTEEKISRSRVNQKKWYNINKTKCNNERRTKITCVCGAEINRNSMGKHQRSKIHINLMS